MALSIDEGNDGIAEVLSKSDFLAKYGPFEELTDYEYKGTQIETDETGNPIQLSRFKTASKLTKTYELKLVRRIRRKSNVDGIEEHYLTLIWVSAGRVWLKTHGSHNLHVGSVVEIRNVSETITGLNVVEDVAWEAGCLHGPTLFTVSNALISQNGIAVDSKRILWVCNEELARGKCTCRFELDTDSEWYEIVCKQRGSVHTRVSNQAIDYPPDLLDNLKSITFGDCRQMSSSTTIPNNSTTSRISESILEVLRQTKIEDLNSGYEAEDAVDLNNSSKQSCKEHGPDESCHGDIRKRSASEERSDFAFSVHQNSPRRIEAGSATELSFETNATELSGVTDSKHTKELISDTSSDGTVETDTEACTISFSATEVGLTGLDLTNPIIDFIVLRYEHEFSDKLAQLGNALRPLLLNDRDGARFVDTATNTLRNGIKEALMQREEFVYLMPQKMYRHLRKTIQLIDVGYQFYGGVLLHLLEGLNNVYREQHFSLQRLRLEEISPDPDKQSTTQTDQLYPLSGDASPNVSVVIHKPHLACILKQPQAIELTDRQLKSLFKNAPYLMKNEVSKPKFLDKMRDYIGQRASGPLRRYQQICVDRFMSGDNYIFVAPTGAGKTKIFVECSRNLLERNRSATIVVICPTVPLVIQQACVYVVEGFLSEGYWVNTFSSDNQLPPEAWTHLACCHNVMVLTPQILLSVVDFYKDVEDFSIFSSIDLLVLDECHHVRKEHAYNKIMRVYQQCPNCRTQVIGFTASPTPSPDIDRGRQNLSVLQNQMQATCVVLDEANLEVQKYAPKAKEETAYCMGRLVDLSFAQSIGQLIYNTFCRYLRPLVGRVQGVRRLDARSYVDMHSGLMCSDYENWAKETTETLEQDPNISYDTQVDLIAAINLLRVCNYTLDLVNDAGYESALRVIARTVIDIAADLPPSETRRERVFPKILAGLFCSCVIQSITQVLNAYSMNPLSVSSTFPRFLALVQFLERYNDDDNLHGMIFAQTRDGVYQLSQMLRYSIRLHDGDLVQQCLYRVAPNLRRATVLEFTGHGATNKKGWKPSCSASKAPRGMTGSKCILLQAMYFWHVRAVLQTTRNS